MLLDAIGRQLAASRGFSKPWDAILVALMATSATKDLCERWVFGDDGLRLFDRPDVVFAAAGRQYKLHVRHWADRVAEFTLVLHPDVIGYFQPVAYTGPASVAFRYAVAQALLRAPNHTASLRAIVLEIGRMAVLSRGVLESMTAWEVGAWLRGHGNAASAAIFEREEVAGRRLEVLTDADLADGGIEDAAERALLLQLIEAVST
jgi:hypothetical protein